MENGWIVAIAIALLLGLLVTGVSVAISLATSGIVGVLLLSGPSVVNSVVAGTSYSAVGSSTLIVVPLFILMGMFTLQSGIAVQLFAVAAKGLKKLPGSLAIATVFASALFSAISGSSLATVATMGRTSITEMMRHGYLRSFAAATVATAGTLGVLIPPSIILVLYGIMTGESVALLLIAGIIPGIISALVMAISIVVRVKRNPSLTNTKNPVKATALAGGQSNLNTEGSEGAASDAPEQVVDVQVSFGPAARAFLGVIVLFSIVIGGIYTGVFTPSESAAVGAAAAFVLLCSGCLTRPRTLIVNAGKALREAISLNSMIFLILVGAGIFSFFLVSAGVPSALSTFVVELPLPPTLVVIILLLFLIPGGMFLDSISLLVITVPLVYEPITALGFDGIWLGIIIVKMIELGMITPPVGMNAFVAAGTTPGLKPEEVFRGLIPYYAVEVATIALLFALPGLITWLPELSAV